jgi:hypothetical protein
LYTLFFFLNTCHTIIKYLPRPSKHFTGCVVFSFGVGIWIGECVAYILSQLVWWLLICLVIMPTCQIIMLTFQKMGADTFSYRIFRHVNKWQKDMTSRHNYLTRGGGGSYATIKMYVNITIKCLSLLFQSVMKAAIIAEKKFITLLHCLNKTRNSQWNLLRKVYSKTELYKITSLDDLKYTRTICINANIAAHWWWEGIIT